MNMQNNQSISEFERVAAKGCFIVSIAVRSGPATTSLSYLGHNDQAAVAMQKAGVKPNTISFNATSLRAYTRLKTLRSKIYSKYALRWDPFYFIAADSAEAFKADIDEMQAELELLREEISDNYEQDKTNYVERLSTALVKIYTDYADIIAKIAEYTECYPTREQLVQGLDAKLTTFLSVPSLSELAEHDANLKRALAERNEQSAILEMQQETFTEMRKAMAQTVEAAKKEISDLLFEQVGLVLQASDDASFNRANKGLKELVTKFTYQAKLDDTLNEILQLTLNSHQTTVGDRESYKQCLHALQAQVEDLITPHITGKNAMNFMYLED